MRFCVRIYRCTLLIVRRDDIVEGTRDRSASVGTFDDMYVVPLADVLFTLTVAPASLNPSTFRTAPLRVKIKRASRATMYLLLRVVLRWTAMQWTAMPTTCTRLCKWTIQYATVELINAIRRESVYTVAATNPGDGTKRLYGETTFIANGSDIEGVHPDAVPHAGKRNAKPDMRIMSDDEESFTYLEDTEARGLVISYRYRTTSDCELVCPLRRHVVCRIWTLKMQASITKA